MPAQAIRQTQRAAALLGNTDSLCAWRSYTPLPSFSKAPVSLREALPDLSAPGRALPWRPLLGALVVGTAALWFSGPGGDALVAVLDSPCTWLRIVPAGTPGSQNLPVVSCNCSR